LNVPKKTLNDVVKVLEKMDGRLSGIEEALGENSAVLTAIAEDVQSIRTQANGLSTAITMLATEYGARLRKLEAAVFPPQH
jgi:archaellum component FlaC